MIGHSERVLPWLFAVVAVVLLAGCGSSTKAANSPQPTLRPSTATTFACAPAREDCTSQDVVATVTQLYRRAGATPAEAACLGPITGAGKHAVNQAFDAPTAEQTKAAITCVGSDARLRSIAAAMAQYFQQHPYG
jgi:hypothetical protein